MNLHGVFAPIPTPFRDGELDLDGLRNNVERWMSTELTGIVVLATNGEAALIDDDEADPVDCGSARKCADWTSAHRWHGTRVDSCDDRGDAPGGRCRS